MITCERRGYAGARADYDQGIAAGKAQSPSTLANYRAFVQLHAGNPAAAIEEVKELVANAENMAIPADQKLQARTFALTNAAAIASHYDMAEEASAAVEQLSTALVQSGEASGGRGLRASTEGHCRLLAGAARGRAQ